MSAASAAKSRRPATRSVETFDTPSGMGGLFTVSITKDLGNERVEVRVHYPSADWDGFRFTTVRDRLKPTGKRVQVAA